MKILVIRFSSFGDVLQTLSVVGALREQNSHLEIHFATGSEFTPLIETHPAIKKVHALKRKSKFFQLKAFAQLLKTENFDLLYDAHNNLRTFFISLILKLYAFTQGRRLQIVRRPTKRWKRFLLFQLRINTYQMPFSGQRDQLEALPQLGYKSTLPPPPQLFIQASVQEHLKQKYVFLNDEFIALAPSAAHELKRWPVEYWKKLIQLCPDSKFVILAGPEDHFVSEIIKGHEHRAYNLAGQLSLLESSAVVTLSQLLICNDTGLMHVAEQTGHNAIALMGPAPFGFPCRQSTVVLQKDLSCRPCSKHGQGPCINKNFHQCLRDITPEEVRQKMVDLTKRVSVT